MTKMRKGMHEKAMEQARDMLKSNLGMTEIVNTTGLSIQEVKKEQGKLNSMKADKRI